MKKVLVLGLVLMTMIGCSAGKDGAAGVNGTNNKIISNMYCYGTFIGGYLDGGSIDYNLTSMSSGDLFVTSNLKLAQFSNSSSRFYSINSVGVDSGFVSINVDNVSYLTIEFINGQLKAKYISSISGNSITYVIPNSNCTITNY